MNKMVFDAAFSTKGWQEFNDQLDLLNGILQGNDDKGLGLENGESLMHLAIRVNSSEILKLLLIRYPDESKQLYDLAIQRWWK